MDDIPEEKRKAITKQVLASLATLRNELAGHGQESSVIEISKPYGVLAIHLAGALNQFIMDQSLRRQTASIVAPDEDFPW